MCIARQTNQDRGFVSIKVSTTRTQNLLRRSNTGSPSDQFVTFLLLFHPGEEMSTSLFCYRSALLFLAHRVESSVSQWGDFSTAFGEGPEQGSAGTSWGSRTSSTPSRESFSGDLPPFVTDGDGWLGRPRGTCKMMYDILFYTIRTQINSNKVMKYYDNIR